MSGAIKFFLIRHQTISSMSTSQLFRLFWIMFCVSQGNKIHIIIVVIVFVIVIVIIIIVVTPCEFFPPALAQSPQVSRILLSMPVDLNFAVV